MKSKYFYKIKFFDDYFLKLIILLINIKFLTWWMTNICNKKSEYKLVHVKDMHVNFLNRF